jgi:hypothetical protein
MEIGMLLIICRKCQKLRPISAHTFEIPAHKSTLFSLEKYKVEFNRVNRTFLFLYWPVVFECNQIIGSEVYDQGHGWLFIKVSQDDTSLEIITLRV